MKLIINALLAFIGRGAYALLALPFFLLGILLSKNKSKYLFNIAISYDQLANTVGAPLFNIILVKKGGYLFGNEDDTISMCLAINFLIGNLTGLGLLIANSLEWLDPGHLERSIEKCNHSKHKST